MAHKGKYSYIVREQVISSVSKQSEKEVGGFKFQEEQTVEEETTGITTENIDTAEELMSNAVKRSWYNNGEKNILASICPEGFVPGKVKTHK